MSKSEGLFPRTSCIRSARPSQELPRQMSKLEAEEVDRRVKRPCLVHALYIAYQINGP